MTNKEDEITRLLGIVKERDTIEERLQLQLDNYEEEHRKMKIDIERLLCHIREVKRLSGHPSTTQEDIGTVTNMVVDLDNHPSSAISGPSTAPVVTIGQGEENSGPMDGAHCNDPVAIPPEINFKSDLAAIPAEINFENHSSSAATTNTTTATVVPMEQEVQDSKPTNSVHCNDLVAIPVEIKRGEQDMDVDSSRKEHLINIGSTNEDAASAVESHEL